MPGVLFLLSCSVPINRCKDANRDGTVHINSTSYDQLLSPLTLCYTLIYTIAPGQPQVGSVGLRRPATRAQIDQSKSANQNQPMAKTTAHGRQTPNGRRERRGWGGRGFLMFKRMSCPTGHRPRRPSNAGTKRSVGVSRARLRFFHKDDMITPASHDPCV